MEAFTYYMVPTAVLSKHLHLFKYPNIHPLANFSQLPG